MHTCITASSSSPAPSARFARPRCPAVCPGECEEGALVYAIPTPRKRPDVYTYRPLSEPCFLTCDSCCSLPQRPCFVEPVQGNCHMPLIRPPKQSLQAL